MTTIKLIAEKKSNLKVVIDKYEHALYLFPSEAYKIRLGIVAVKNKTPNKTIAFLERIENN